MKINNFQGELTDISAKKEVSVYKAQTGSKYLISFVHLIFAFYSLPPQHKKNADRGFVTAHSSATQK